MDIFWILWSWEEERGGTGAYSIPVRTWIWCYPVHNSSFGVLSYPVVLKNKVLRHIIRTSPEVQGKSSPIGWDPDSTQNDRIESWHLCISQFNKFCITTLVCRNLLDLNQRSSLWPKTSAIFLTVNTSSVRSHNDLFTYSYREPL